MHLSNAIAIEFVDGRWIAHELWEQMLSRPLDLALKTRLVNQFIFENEKEMNRFMLPGDSYRTPLQEVIEVARPFRTSMVMTVDELLGDLEQNHDIIVEDDLSWARALQTMEISYREQPYEFGLINRHLLPPKLKLNQPLNDVTRFHLSTWLRKAGTIMDIHHREPQTLNARVSADFKRSTKGSEPIDDRWSRALSDMLLTSNDGQHSLLIREGWRIDWAELCDGEPYSMHVIEVPSLPQRLTNHPARVVELERIQPLDVQAAA